MCDSDDDLLSDPMPRRRSTRASVPTKNEYREDAPTLGRFSAMFSVKDLLKEQDQEQKKKEAIRQQAPVMPEDDDMLIDDDELARFVGEGQPGKGSAMQGIGPDLDLDDDADIDLLNARIKSLKPQRDDADSELDMENEDFADWRGLTAVFYLAERNKIRNLDFRSFVKEAGDWSDDYRKLYSTLSQAAGRLPDLLCATGVARWLAATQLRVPPQLMEWLVHVLALTDEPALARGAFLNVRALMRGPTEELPLVVSELLDDWTLPFSTLAKILEYYGIRLLATSPEGTRAIEFLRKIDTTKHETKTSRVTIPPILNLGFLFQTMQWLVEDGRITGDDDMDCPLLLLSCTRFLSIDRQVQAGCPRELCELTGALLRKVPAENWPEPMIKKLKQAVFERQDVMLNTDSALQMTRTLGLRNTRERELMLSFAAYILCTRVLPEATEPLQGMCVVADPEDYLLTLLDVLNSPNLDAMFTDAGAEVTFHTAYCIELLSKALFAGKGFHAAVFDKVNRFEKTRRHGVREEEAQSTKDILTAEALGLKLFGPRGSVQKKLGFSGPALVGTGQTPTKAGQN